MDPSSLTFWSNGGISRSGGKSEKEITRMSPTLMNSAEPPLVVVAPGLGATAVAAVLPGEVPPCATGSIPGTSEKPESALSVWHPAKNNPVNNKQDATQKRPQICPTFVITMRPLILLTLWSRRDRFCRLRREQQVPHRHCGNNNRGNSRCNSSSSRLATY